MRAVDQDAKRYSCFGEWSPDPHVAGILTMDQNASGYFCEANAAHYRVLAELRRCDQAAGCGFLNILNASYGFYGHAELLKT